MIATKEALADPMFWIKSFKGKKTFKELVDSLKTYRRFKSLKFDYQCRVLMDALEMYKEKNQIIGGISCRKIAFNLLEALLDWSEKDMVIFAWRMRLFTLM